MNRQEFDAKVGAGAKLVLYDDPEDQKTFILDLAGFVHPGPLLTDGAIVQPGMNVTSLFHSKPFHDGKSPTASIKIVGTLKEQNGDNDASCASEESKEGKCEESEDPILDEMVDLYRKVCKVVISFKRANPNPSDRDGEAAAQNKQQIHEDVNRFLPIVQEMRELVEAEAYADLSKFLVSHKLPYWEFPILEDLLSIAKELVLAGQAAGQAAGHSAKDLQVCLAALPPPSHSLDTE